MLGKLIKYEFKATSRIFLPMIAALLIIAVVNAFCYPFGGNYQLPKLIAMFLYVAAIVSVAVLALLVTIRRFYCSLLTDEGYLMMTLPASADAHIWSKAITAAVWVAASLLVSLLSMFIIFLNVSDFSSLVLEISDGISEISGVMGIHVWLLAALWLVILIVDLFSQLMVIYMCITIGHQMPKHPIAGGVGAYIGYAVLCQIIGSGFMYFSYHVGLAEWFSSLGGMEAGYIFSFACLIIVAVVLAVTYLVTRRLLKYHLNLE